MSQITDPEDQESAERERLQSRFIARYGYPLPPMRGGSQEADDEDEDEDDDEKGKDEKGKGKGKGKDDKDDKDESRELKAERRRALALERRLAKYLEQEAEEEEKGKSDTERLSGKLKSTETDLSAAQLTILKYEVAADADLPLSAAKRLVGKTRDELEEDAEELAKLFAKENAADTDEGDDEGDDETLDGGVRRSRKPRGTPEQQHADLLANIFGGGKQRGRRRR